MGTTFSKKGVYHSELARETENGALTVMLKGDPRESKFAGKPPYAYFTVLGDDEEYSYTVENESCGEAWTNAPKGLWVDMIAGGSRDLASLLFSASESEGEPAPKPQTAPSQSTPSNVGGGIAGDMQNALEVAVSVLQVFAGRHKRSPTDEELRVAASLFIQEQRNK